MRLTRLLRSSGNEVAQQFEWIDSKSLRDLQELNHIQPTFAALELRHVGLRAIQPLREHGLRQTQGLSGFDQKLTKA